MIVKKIDAKKEGEKLRSFYNQYFNKQDEIKRSTRFRVEVFGNIIPKETISHEQITKLNIF